jgi:membrane protein involved in colicin uptake
LEEQLTKLIDGQKVKQEYQSFTEQERQIMARKKERQLKMKRELDQLVELRKQQDLDRECKLNVVEFALNRKSLKELGVVDQAAME